MANILVVDDDELFRELLCTSVERHGHKALAAGTLAQARRIAARNAVDVVYLDVRLPDGSGALAIEELRAGKDPPEVIIVTGQGDPDGAELALRCGAWDYIEKPASVDRMTLPMLRALSYRAEKRRQRIPALPETSGIVGKSPRLAACLAQAGMAAASGVDVFITGETGTGKEIFARAIHASGGRAQGPFVVVDCTTLPGTLAESVLFGHERGSFTGADRKQTGLIEQADGGTLFLDEIGELPLLMQAKFLRVLQERSFRPVGGGQLHKSEFRLVAATNRDLAAMAERGEFRQDLLFRLGAFCLELPPLREREGDIKELLDWRMAQHAARAGNPAPEPSPEYLELLLSHHWPGNVREFLQTVDMSLVSAMGEAMLLPQHLPLDLRVRLMRGRVASRGLSPVEGGQERAAGTLGTWREHRARLLDRAEAEYFSALMDRAGGDAALAAELSGLKSARLYELLGKHGLVKGRRGPA
ncbi:two-component system, NtrC family, response regulator [Humidesulfovibrio mexicanus]|uniref:Two-component system, NtrC family, response regulator n=1 Tax=Humidesulfovibrio mexicanus TaxID=147047 RepID=A0A238ZZM0_9BACT|nr:sigma-54 dependent transcriptional regulator [Humidesulfovibrio mexicanus]SNR88886.1 two-component system, NtrC family, response regulator [Humidesulfovibrio mexicanus]